MLNIRILAGLSAAILLVGCSTVTTHRQINQLESHGDNVLMSYTEVVVKESPMTLKESAPVQKVATCSKQDAELVCSELNVTIDNLPLVVQNTAMKKDAAKQVRAEKAAASAEKRAAEKAEKERQKAAKEAKTATEE